MTSEDKMWENLKAEYLRRVEKALSSVRHPHVEEVLGDVRSHLEQRFAGLKPDQRTRKDLEGIIAEMGPASEYAELLSSDTVPPAQRTWRKYLIPAGLIIVIIAAVVLVPMVLSPTAGYIVKFEPVAPFQPQTAKELLKAFNDEVKFRVTTHHFRTEVKGSMLTGYICTNTKADKGAIATILSDSKKLKLISTRPASSKGLEKHYVRGQPGLKKTIEKSIQKELSDKVGQRKLKRIKELIAKRYMLKKQLADRERFQALPNVQEKLAEYTEKLEQIKKAEEEQVSSKVAKKREEEWERFKARHGDNWEKVYSYVRGAVSALVVIEARGTDIQPFAAYMEYGSKLQLWQAGPGHYSYAGHDSSPAGRKKAAAEHLEQTVEKYKAPPAVLEHARKDSMKELYRWGYKYLIQLFSEEKRQEQQKELKQIETELDKYPTWQEIEQELLQFFDSGSTPGNRIGGAKEINSLHVREVPVKLTQ